MPKVTKATIAAKIQERTGLTRYKSKKGLKAALNSIKIALQMGKQVECGKLGRLVVVERKRKRVIRKNLKGSYPCSVVELHKEHPKSVRLRGGKDMSEHPLPTIITRPEPDLVPPKYRHIAIAFPAWRQRRRFR